MFRSTPLMMGVLIILTTGVVLTVLLNPTSADEGKIKSGPQVGESLAGPFHPLNINGSMAGQKHCLYCENGNNPVAMVFARCHECPQTAKLIQKLDQVTSKQASANMGSFVVYLNDKDGLSTDLKKLAEDKKLSKTVLSIDNPAGPNGYNIAKDADVTVVLYVNRTVKANHSFKKGSMSDKDIETILADVAKIVK